MKVCDVKNMSWEQHIVIWKVCQELDLATSQLVSSLVIGCCKDSASPVLIGV